MWVVYHCIIVKLDLPRIKRLQLELNVYGVATSLTEAKKLKLKVTVCLPCIPSPHIALP